MPHPDDTELARLAVESKLARQEEVAAAQEARLAESQAGRVRPLAEVLVERQVLTPGQVERLAGEIETAKPSQQIPGYQILSKVGAGAMAKVYKARQLSLDRVVAIKVLPKKWSNDPEFVERFYKEGKAAAQLSHNNIVQAIDVGEAGGYHYFVMEFVEGHTVHDELVRNKVYSEKEALDIVIQMAKALAHAHERGFIHRDVKPKNIMLTKDRVAKLADMGLARQASDEEAARSEAGKAYGTPYYISPEQIRGEMDIDFRADIYSLGATAYHMVTGRVPFDGPTPAAVMHKHLKEELIPPDHINKSLSAGMAEVIEMMMARERHHRYKSTRELLQDLEAVAKGEQPMIARGASDSSGMLDALAQVEAGAQQTPQEVVYVADPRMRLWLILLAAALGLSVLINLLQLLF
ncbi:MAG: Serine/threonine-protein kinase PknD [Phycisphaerae bacterium]|nr:Serine/threonine-protein kinase PknD [Phycisphaerae bacterium]